MQSVGRRGLLLTSVICMGIMSSLLAWGIDDHHKIVSAIAIVSFIVSARHCHPRSETYHDRRPSPLVWDPCRSC